MKDSSLKYIVALTKIDGLGAKRLNKLLKSFSSPREIWYSSVNELKKVEGLGDVIAKNICDQRSFIEPEKEISLLKKGGIKAILPWDEAYPQDLAEIYSPPALLYCKGKLELLNYPILGVVGTRSPSRYGYEVLKELLPALCEAGIVILSGFARGIDGMAHKICLENEGHTIAVLGGGLDKVYPPEHNNLYKSISKEGLLISEYPLGASPVPGNFPARNRIISALSKALLIVEAPKKSGTMITAEHALEQNKEVLVVPGNITSPKSKGCNELLSQGAKPVLSADDILEEFDNFFMNHEATIKNNMDDNIFDNKVGTDSKILHKIPFYPYKLNLEELLLESGLKYEIFIQEILELELNGLAIKQPGGYISRIK